MAKNRNKQTKVWNRLFVLVAIVAALLLVLLGWMLFKKERALDLSMAYEISEYDGESSSVTHEMEKASSFASDLVVSDSSVVLDNVSLNASTEKGLLFNLDSKTPVFAQGIYDKAYPASITKIMTALLVIEYADMNQTVVMIDEDFQLEEGSQMSGLAPGDQVTVDQLFHILLIFSANDAANALARTVSGSVEGFVQLMNDRAMTLGMTGTHFENPHGLHNSNHYTTAYDVYLMLQEAYKYDAFKSCIQLNMYQFYYVGADGAEHTIRLDSTDKYLTGEHAVPQDVFLVGGKTGTTDEAGACLALISQNKYGIPYASVILNAYNRSVLYDDMDKLLSSINLTES